MLSRTAENQCLNPLLRPPRLLASSLPANCSYFASNNGTLQFPRDKLKVGDTVRLRNRIMVRIKTMTRDEISGDALFPFQQIIDQDNYSTDCSGNLGLETHRQPCQPAKSGKMIDGNLHESLHYLHGPLSTQRSDGSILADIHYNTPPPPGVASKLGRPSAAAINWDRELVWAKFHTGGRRKRCRSQEIMVAAYSDILGICRVVFTNLPHPYLPVESRSPSISFSEKILRVLAFDEADVDARAGPDVLRQEWTKWRASPVLKSARANSKPKPYTMGDTFCGGGGTSRGAEQAGLLPAWGFDANEEAMRMFAANFAVMNTKCLMMCARDFLKRAGKSGYGIDVLHASPPCQRFVTNTVGGPDQRDYDNVDSVSRLLRLTTPRILTFEEVKEFGKTPLFDRLLYEILSEGYSLRWKVANCCGFGVPQQQRRRLILIASAPGETLPALPWPTHEESRTPRPPFASIGNFINSNYIPTDAEDHHPTGTRSVYEAYNAYEHRAGTILCKGENMVKGRLGDPTGTHAWTIRELAALQTFPAAHVFCHGKVSRFDAKRIVGNAVPPLLAKQMFLQIKASLETTDRDYEQRTAPPVRAARSGRSATSTKTNPAPMNDKKLPKSTPPASRSTSTYHPDELKHVKRKASMSSLSGEQIGNKRRKC